MAQDLLDSDRNVLLAVLGDPESGLDFGAGEHLNNVAGEAGEVTEVADILNFSSWMVT